MSKWIEEFEEAYDTYGDDYEESLLPILQRIDKLFKKAMNLVDDPNLYDEMRKEINGTD